MSATQPPPPFPPTSASRPPDRAGRIALTILAIAMLLALACTAAGVALWWLRHDRIKSSDDAQVTSTSPPAAQVVVLARFKHEDGAAIRMWQRALVSVPQAPGVQVPGVVTVVIPQADEPATAQGNFVKVVRRDLVRIHLNAPPAQSALFLQGMAVRVKVDTGTGR